MENIADYLRDHAQEFGDRILQSCPPLHSIDDCYRMSPDRDGPVH